MQTQVKAEHSNRRLTENFYSQEFICPCCGAEGITDELVFHLQLAHNLLPSSSVIVITSGYRCEKHNKAVGGVEHSSHRKGLAADIRCINSTYRFFLIQALLKVGFQRIGYGKDFVHCDFDTKKPQEVIWDYY